MTAIKPITPAAARESYEAGKDTPEFIIEVLNEMIDEYYHPDGFILSQDDVIAVIMAKNGSVTRQEVFDRKWLNFERVFRSYGWDVQYVKPGIGETGIVHFKFSGG